MADGAVDGTGEIYSTATPDSPHGLGRDGKDEDIACRDEIEVGDGRTDGGEVFGEYVIYRRICAISLRVWKPAPKRRRTLQVARIAVKLVEAVNDLLLAAVYVDFVVDIREMVGETTVQVEQGQPLAKRSGGWGTAEALVRVARAPGATRRAPSCTESASRLYLPPKVTTAFLIEYRRAEIDGKKSTPQSNDEEGGQLLLGRAI